MSGDLKPCPMCGPDGHVELHGSIARGGRFVRCEICGTTGPANQNQVKAIAAWNTRAEERPSATDYRNRGERDAAYWRDLCAELIYSTGTDLDRVRIAVVEELARINAEALR